MCAVPPASETDANQSEAAIVIDETAVRQVLEKLRPFLQQDGGDLEYVGIVGDEVQIRLQGACVTCSSATATLKMGIENQLREEVPGVATVVAV